MLVERLSKRRPKASTTKWLSSAGFNEVTIALLREVTSNTIPSDPAAVAQLVKELPIDVRGLAPIERAISSAGGITFDQIDDKYMLTSLPGNFVAGEMLDWEAPTGGYLLQACFSTGYAAARGVLDYLSHK